MSQDRRPSPIQPRDVSTYADSMARVQQPQGPRLPSFLEPSEERLSNAPVLPAIQGGAFQSLHHHDGRTLPPIQLPPLRTSAPEQQRSPHSNTEIPINSLLANDAEGARTTKSGLHQPPASQTKPSKYYSPGSSWGSSQSDNPAHPPVNPPVTQHALDRPPMPYRGSSQTSQLHHYPYPHPRHASAASEPDQHARSPATSAQSYSPSYYSHSSDPSPRASMTASGPFASQPKYSQPPPLDYNLIIRQQPAAARACGFGERDRRVIDPPPILELKITDKATGAPEQDSNAMLALNCTLLSPDGKEDETEVPPAHPDMASTRRLMGTLVAAPYQAKDEHGVAGTFFVFPDLSCRSPGKYRLKFRLLRVDPTNMTPGARHPSVSAINTDVFSVFTAKDFPGMRASSALLKALRRQGLNVGVKKGSEARRNKGKAKKSSGSDEEDEDSESDNENESGDDAPMEERNPKSKSRKKGKRRKKES